MQSEHVTRVLELDAMDRLHVVHPTDSEAHGKHCEIPAQPSMHVQMRSLVLVGCLVSTCDSGSHVDIGVHLREDVGDVGTFSQVPTSHTAAFRHLSCAASG